MTSWTLSEAPSARALGVLRWCPFWVGLLLITLMVPTDLSFSLGSMRLTPYRLVLIVSFMPALLTVLGGRAGRMHIVDFLVLCHVLWAYIVIAYHHGSGAALESGGIRMLEFSGAYLIARAYVVNEQTFRGACAMLFAILIALLPFLLVESVTGRHVIREVAAALSGNSFYTDMGTRFGLTRAYGPFDHPILLGVFAASALGIAWMGAVPALGRPNPKRWPVAASFLGAVTSLSAGALAGLMTQVLLIVWEARTRLIVGRWKTLSGLLFAAYITVDTLSNRSGYHVFLHYLTFSAHTAYNRIIIFEWGIQDVWRNPVFGIGFNVWTRPSWMHSTSMDNFWLVQAVTFGIPGFLTIALAYIFILSLRWRDLPERLTRVRMGWTISIIGLMVAGCTVHFWNNLFVIASFMLGLGAWFLVVDRVPPVSEDEP